MSESWVSAAYPNFHFYLPQKVTVLISELYNLVDKDIKFHYPLINATRQV
jgi:hypothetical protein